MPPFIKVAGLRKRYGEHVVIDKLNLEIEAGEIVVFQGPSGIGKSTFLRSLIYLEPFESGNIHVGPVEIMGGMDEHRDRARLLALREQLGYVFQFFNLFPHLSVLQNLMIGPVRVLGQAVESAEGEARRLLDRIGLAAKADAFPHRLSGGQQQRVAIARALAMHPKGILLDEPTSSLDPAMKSEIIQVIDDFARDGLTMLIVTHEPGVIDQVATRMITFGPGLRITADDLSGSVRRPR